MLSSLPPLKLTYEDYLHLPEDGKRHELIDGEHLLTPSPNTRHQFVTSNLHRLLSGFVHTQGLGRVCTAPLDVVLSATDVVQPDLLFVASERLDRFTEAHLRGAPDLAIEILSESTRRTDEITKRHLYERYGVAEYWIVDPVVETVKIFRLADGRFHRGAELSLEAEDLLTTALLPGLEIPLAQIFA